MSREETFQCQCCGQEFSFEKGEVWSHEDAVREAETLYPGVPIQEMAVVCDDCFLEIRGETGSC